MKNKIKLLRERGPRAAKARLHSLVQQPRSNGHVLMLHNGRSGSTLLGDMLDQHNSIFWDGETIEKRVHEIENKEKIGHELMYGRISLDDGIELIEKRIRRCAGNKIFGTELQDYHLKMMETDFEAFLDRMQALGFTRFIYLERNYIRKIVSHIMATEREQFHIKPNQKANIKTVKINPERIYIGHRFTTLLEALDQYRDFSENTHRALKNQSVLNLTYEQDIKFEPASAAQKVCDFLGLEFHHPKVNFGKTTNVPLSEVVENYGEVRQYLLANGYTEEIGEGL